MDIGHIESVASYRHIVRHPKTHQELRSDTGKPSVIVIASPQHPEYQRRRMEMNRALTAQVTYEDEAAAFDLASTRAAVAAVLDWGDLTVDGKPIAENPMAALNQPKMYWLVSQVLRTQSTGENFIAPSAPA